MKKNYIIPVLALASMTTLALTKMTAFDFQQRSYMKGHKYAAGAPAARTGAPGEANCTECHSGTTQDGNAINALVLKDAGGNTVTSYIPDSTYSVNFIINNPAVKKGFQVVALTVNGNAQAGTVTALTGTQIVTSGGRQYVNHRSTSNTTTSGWNFKWKAPSSNVGNVRFYAAANVTNNSGTDNGDMIYLSQHNVLYNALASIEEEKVSLNFSALYASTTNTLDLSFDSRISGEGHLNLIDLNGRSVYNNRFGTVKIGSNKEKVLLPDNIQTGIYIAHLFVNNQSSTVKVMISK